MLTELICQHFWYNRSIKKANKVDIISFKLNHNNEIDFLIVLTFFDLTQCQQYLDLFYENDFIYHSDQPYNEKLQVILLGTFGLKEIFISTLKEDTKFQLLCRIINDQTTSDEDLSFITQYSFDTNIQSDVHFAYETIERLVKQEQPTVLVADGAYNPEDARNLDKTNGIDLVNTELKGRHQILLTQVLSLLKIIIPSNFPIG